jgi:hypothetical protein
MLQTIRDWMIILAAGKSLGAGKYIKELIFGFALASLALLLLVGVMAVLYLSVGIVALLLFAVCLCLAVAYSKSALLCCIPTFLAGAYLNFGATDQTLSWFAGAFLMLFAIYTFPSSFHPPILTKWIAWRMVMIVFYVLWSMMFLVKKAEIPYQELIFVGTCIGGVALNRLLFGKFQWRYLQEYVELVNKYGNVLSDKDRATFNYKLEQKFGVDWATYTLEHARDNPKIPWSDRIMYAYLIGRVP